MFAFAAGYTGTTKNLQFVLNTQKSPYLNQATQKDTFQISQNRKFQTPKNPLIIPVTLNPEYHYSGITCGNVWLGFTLYTTM